MNRNARHLTHAIALGCALASAEICLLSQQRPADFVNYINGKKKYQSVLMLGMFNGPEDADKYKARDVIHPITGRPFDKVIALGRSGDEYKLWEVVRVVGDNLSWSPLTDYTKLDGIEVEELVAHSNANDFAANAIKAGILTVDKEFLALAPPAGFEAEARFLPVPKIRVFQREGDKVTHELGKTLLGPVMRLLQRHSDVDLGVLSRNSWDGQDLFVGMKMSRPLGFKPPVIEVHQWTDANLPFPVADRVYYSERQYREMKVRFPRSGPVLDRFGKPLNDRIGIHEFYLDLSGLSTAERESVAPALSAVREKPLGPHSYRTYSNGLVYEEMRSTTRAIHSENQSITPWSKVHKEWAKLAVLADRSPEAFALLVKEDPYAASVSDRQVRYLATPDYAGKPLGKAYAEADSLFYMTKDSAKIVVTGNGRGADRAFEKLKRELGDENVIRDKNPRTQQEARRYAGDVGADTVLNFTAEARGDAFGAAAGSNARAPGGVLVPIDISDADFVMTKGRRP